MTGVLLVVLAIGAVAAAFLLYVRWDAKHHRHMRSTDYREGNAWHAFDAAMSKHTQEKP